MNQPHDSVRICPECGADNLAFATSCWMCYRDIRNETPIIEAVAVDSSPKAAVAQRPSYAPGEWFFRIATFLVLVLLVLVGIGLATEEVGLVIVYALLVTPPLLGALFRIRRRAKQGHVSWGEKFATLLMSGAIMIGILGVLWIAALGALVAFCFVAIATGNL